MDGWMDGCSSSSSYPFLSLSFPEVRGVEILAPVTNDSIRYFYLWKIYQVSSFPPVDLVLGWMAFVDVVSLGTTELNFSCFLC